MPGAHRCRCGGEGVLELTGCQCKADRGQPKGTGFSAPSAVLLREKLQSTPQGAPSTPLSYPLLPSPPLSPSPSSLPSPPFLPPSPPWVPLLIFGWVHSG